MGFISRRPMLADGHLNVKQELANLFRMVEKTSKAVILTTAIGISTTSHAAAIKVPTVMPVPGPTTATKLAPGGSVHISLRGIPKQMQQHTTAVWYARDGTYCPGLPMPPPVRLGSGIVGAYSSTISFTYTPTALTRNCTINVHFRIFTGPIQWITYDGNVGPISVSPSRLSRTGNSGAVSEPQDKVALLLLRYEENPLGVGYDVGYGSISKDISEGIRLSKSNPEKAYDLFEEASGVCHSNNIFATNIGVYCASGLKPALGKAEGILYNTFPLITKIKVTVVNDVRKIWPPMVLVAAIAAICIGASAYRRKKYDIR
ncbi:MAG: hypothetical protein KGH72_00545 [Candidatus Micrarchaeota archaeon]|nr:hypothetical protein [Candidatus Micrarchaeota archaeon]